MENNNLIVFTVDLAFKDEISLNNSVNSISMILEEFKNDRKIEDYYTMRYIPQMFLGVKLILPKHQVEERIKEIESKLISLSGFNSVVQRNNEGVPSKENYLAAASTQLRNKAFDILGRKPTDEEFLFIIHYIANPLFFSSADEVRIHKRALNITQ